AICVLLLVFRLARVGRRPVDPPVLVLGPRQVEAEIRQRIRLAVAPVGGDQQERRIRLHNGGHPTALVPRRPLPPATTPALCLSPAPFPPCTPARWHTGPSPYPFAHMKGRRRAAKRAARSIRSMVSPPQVGADGFTELSLSTRRRRLTDKERPQVPADPLIC